MSNQRKWQTIVGGLAIVAMTSCGSTEAPVDEGDISGVAELAQPLAALATPPAFATGTLTVTLAAGEIAVISKHAISGNILVNDVFATGATGAAVKNIAITGAGGAPGESRYNVGRSPGVTKYSRGPTTRTRSGAGVEPVEPGARSATRAGPVSALHRHSSLPCTPSSAQK